MGVFAFMLGLAIGFYLRAIKPLLKGKRPRVIRAYRATYKRILIPIGFKPATNTVVCLYGRKSFRLSLRWIFKLPNEQVRIADFWWEPYLLELKVFNLPTTSILITYYKKELWEWAITHREHVSRLS